jgi:hypothetical protein
LGSDIRAHGSRLPRSPPLREVAGGEHEPTADPTLSPIPAYEFDQRIAW